MNCLHCYSFNCSQYSIHYTRLRQSTSGYLECNVYFISSLSSTTTCVGWSTVVECRPVWWPVRVIQLSTAYFHQTSIDHFNSTSIDYFNSTSIDYFDSTSIDYFLLNSISFLPRVRSTHARGVLGSQLSLAVQQHYGYQQY